MNFIQIIYFCIKFGLIFFWLPTLVFTAVYTTVAMLNLAVCRRLMNVIGLSAFATWVSFICSGDALSRAREAHDVAAYCRATPGAWVIICLVMTVVGLAIVQAQWATDFWRPTRRYRRYLILPAIAAIVTYLAERAGDYHSACVT